MDSSQDTFISSTMWTERIGPTAALAMIKKHQRVNASIHMMAMGDAVLNGWLKCAKDNDINIATGGISPLVHFSFQCSNSCIINTIMKFLKIKLNLT